MQWPVPGWANIILVNILRPVLESENIPIYDFQKMPFCARISNLTVQTKFVLSTHKATKFNLTFYKEPFLAQGPLLYLEFDVTAKTLVSGNFTVDGKKVQFRQRPDQLSSLAVVEEGSVDEMISLNFPNKDQMIVVRPISIISSW